MPSRARSSSRNDAAHLAFINQAVRVSSGGSGPPSLEGWYNQLLFNPSESLDFGPTIADVHADVGGDMPPRDASVLHVGTGHPRLMVVTVDWSERLESTTPPQDVPWMDPVLAKVP